MHTDAWLRYLPEPAHPIPEGVPERLRRIEDRLAVEEHIYRWTYLHDAGAIDEKVALHSADCLIHHRAGDIRGSEAIRAFFTVGPPNGQIRNMRHHVTNLTVRFDPPDGARTLAMYVWTQDVLDEKSGRWRPALGGGWYADALRRERDTWLFVERHFLRTYDFYLDDAASFGDFGLAKEAVRDEDLAGLVSRGLVSPRLET